MEQAVLQLRAADSDGMNPITGTITLEIGDETVEALLTASLTEAPFESLLPIFHAITDELTARGSAREESAGRSVTCRAGCAACCRQVVPLAAAEARHIAALVAAMPDERRRVLEARFADGRDALAAAGLTTQAAAIAVMGHTERDEYGRRYFRLGLACPFPENENCTIHPECPLACREYLVTSRPAPAPIRLTPSSAACRWPGAVRPRSRRAARKSRGMARSCSSTR